MKNKIDRIRVLAEQHNILENKLDVAVKHLAGSERVGYIKKRKLQIKDEITKLQRELDNEQ